MTMQLFLATILNRELRTRGIWAIGHKECEAIIACLIGDVAELTHERLNSKLPAGQRQHTNRYFLSEQIRRSNRNRLYCSDRLAGNESTELQAAASFPISRPTLAKAMQASHETVPMPKITDDAHNLDKRDDAARIEAMRGRIHLIGHERIIPLVELKKALQCKPYDLKEFAERHKISMCWLMTKSLKGLLYTTQRLNKQRPKASKMKSFGELYLQLSPSQQQKIRDKLREIAQKR